MSAYKKVAYVNGNKSMMLFNIENLIIAKKVIQCIKGNYFSNRSNVVVFGCGNFVKHLQ